MRLVNRWLVTVIWLLSLALPLQGLAASMPVGAALAGHMAPAAEAPEAGSHPCHQDGSAADAAVTADPHAGCAACAACHGSSAPASTMAGLPEGSAPATAVPDWHAPALLQIVPEGPERPPRSVLA